MAQNEHPLPKHFLAETWGALGGYPHFTKATSITGEGALASGLPLGGLAGAAFAAAGAAVSELVEARAGSAPEVRVDRGRATGWCFLPPGNTQNLYAVAPRTSA